MEWIDGQILKQITTNRDNMLSIDDAKLAAEEYHPKHDLSAWDCHCWKARVRVISGDQGGKNIPDPAVRDPGGAS